MAVYILEIIRCNGEKCSTLWRIRFDTLVKHNGARQEVPQPLLHYTLWHAQQTSMHDSMSYDIMGNPQLKHSRLVVHYSF